MYTLIMTAVLTWGGAGGISVETLQVKNLETCERIGENWLKKVHQIGNSHPEKYPHQGKGVHSFYLCEKN